MFFKAQLLPLALYAVLVQQAQAHGTITQVTGANGVNGQGFGIIASTPRNGGLPVPFEQDTSIIRNNEIAAGTTGVCGRTKAGGNNDVASQLAAASQAGLPSASSDGTVTMNLHQVNQDGAGPYTCDVSGDGGQTFQDATVTSQVPGVNSLSLAVAQDFPLAAQMPAGMQCTAGPNGDACIMRCRNSALAGPFGSCVAVSNGSGNTTSTSTGTNTTDTSSTGTTSTGTTATGTDSTDSADSDTSDTGSDTDTDTTSAGTTTADSDSDTTGAATGSTSTDSTTSGADTEAASTGAAAGGAAGGIASKLKAAFTGKGAKKRFVTSRVVGKRSNFWIDA